ncbi:DNA-directed RNA polymerase, mitochondrial-like [Anneissia japonica]|uniref:DNA-directed RNA polymerase, mitochondrial-like n=1 Tax=Anneissia japonica TaxID=1529436 RepID=UPI001425A0FD|nr:DNA-directed RNA polymerase, mitochondrial-like [Anneissia japonica]
MSLVNICAVIRMPHLSMACYRTFRNRRMYPLLNITTLLDGKIHQLHSQNNDIVNKVGKCATNSSQMQIGNQKIFEENAVEVKEDHNTNGKTSNQNMTKFEPSLNAQPKKLLTENNTNEDIPLFNSKNKLPNKQPTKTKNFRKVQGKTTKSPLLLKHDKTTEISKKKLKNQKKLKNSQTQKFQVSKKKSIDEKRVPLSQSQQQAKKSQLFSKKEKMESENLLLERTSNNYTAEHIENYNDASKNENLNASSKHFRSLKEVEHIGGQSMHLRKGKEPKTSLSSSALISHQREQKEFEETAVEVDVGEDNKSSHAFTKKMKHKVKATPNKKVPDSNQMPLHKTYFTHPHSYLLPYLEVCIFTGMLSRAELMFQKFKYSMPLDVEVFNVLLHGWAKEGDLNKIRKLFKEMGKLGVKADLQSYAAVLECIGRNNVISSNAALKCISEMKKNGLDVHNILSVRLTEDQRNCVVDALQKSCPSAIVQRDFKPHVCRNRLVEDYYCEHHNQVDIRDESEKVSKNINFKDMMKNIMEQVKIEECGHMKVKSVDIEDKVSPQIQLKRKHLKEHDQEWRSCLSRAFDEVKFGHNNKSLSGIANFYPFMCLFDTEEYVDIMLQTLHTLATSSEGNARVNLSVELGQRLFHKYVIMKKIKTGVSKKINQLYERFVPLCLNEEQLIKKPLRETWQEIEHQHPSGASLDTESNMWSRPVVLSIGSLLADMMLHEINIDSNLRSTSARQMIPALYHIFDYRSLKTVGFVKPHPKLVSLIQDACLPDVVFDSNHVPMLSPPLPWCSHKFGGYLFSSCSVMRTRDDSLQVELLKDKIQRGDLNPVLDSLNQLSNTPWIVNKPVLDIVLDIFRNGGDEKLNIPPPSSVCPEPPSYSKGMTSEAMIEIQKLRMSSRKKKSEMHSLRMNEVYKLSIANAFRNKIFWFPHNMDFRGRVYPYPPHFNHLGNDVTRSLLLFGHGKPLGEHGLKWIKIHLVNLTGLKKRASQNERLEYADSIMPLILDSANDPLKGQRWWQTVDNIWQTLAACKEINAAINSPDHTKYISHLPVHQDGSCNGLQHYAALGRDAIGAQQVNLYPMALPQDVYNGVAQMVEELRVEDAKDGHPIAILLKDQIHRKIVKQTVMTVVYGVTAYGGRLQILKQLREVKDLTFDQQWAASAYIVVKVFLSLRKMFTKTRQIQDWLTDSAWMISKAGELVQWETPLGLPVVQPYQKKISNRPNKSSKSMDPIFTRYKPDTMKQKNAFPPNFIHSLDSAHMMLTSLFCQRAGITFSSVHDCFWTHPSTVDIMNKVCRNQFVNLHSEPILDDLGQSLIRKFGNLQIPAGSRFHQDQPNATHLKHFIERIPSKGEFDLNHVNNSTYFFS